MRLIDQFRRGLRRDPKRPALIQGERSLSWHKTNEKVEEIAAAMVAAGLGAESRIAVFSPNDIDAFLAILSIFRVGGAWVPVNARNARAANRHWLELAKCEALFYHSALETEALALSDCLVSPEIVVCIDRDVGLNAITDFIGVGYAPAPEPPDIPEVIANIFPTGGTTGLSKAACWTHSVWEALVGTFWQCLPSSDTAVHLVAAPMTHAAGVLALCAMAEGATNVIIDRPAPDQIMDAIARHRVSHLYLPPTALYNLLDHPGVRECDYSSLRYLMVAAAPIAPARLSEAMEVFGPVLCQCYGQAEAPMFLTFLSSQELLSGPTQRWASCGRPTLAMRVEIMDESGAILNVGMRGEIVARGPLLMPFYLDNPEATNAIRHDGWHRTGDIGYFDASGFLSIIDRVKDIIITGGFNVYSSEIEQVLLEEPAILDCAVVGVPDPKWGEAVKAVVQLRDGMMLNESRMLERVRERLGAVHVPKTVDIWTDLPRSPAGKILKRDIRDSFWRGVDRAVG